MKKLPMGVRLLCVCGGGSKDTPKAFAEGSQPYELSPPHDPPLTVEMKMQSNTASEKYRDKTSK